MVKRNKVKYGLKKIKNYIKNSFSVILNSNIYGASHKDIVLADFSVDIFLFDKKVENNEHFDQNDAYVGLF